MIFEPLPRTDSLAPITAGAAARVDVRHIERDLAALWRKASERGLAVTRACLWNLVVPARDPLAHARAKALLEQALPAVPARVIHLITAETVEDVVVHDAPTDDEIAAYISAACYVAPGGGKMLCSEEVTLRATGRGTHHLPSLVRALLVADVPAALMWLSPDLEPVHEARAMIHDLDRLVVHSGTDDPRLRLSTLATLSREVDVADLGWLRLGPFRWFLASLFDPPADQGRVHALKRIALECAPHGRLGAELILGWLASRLDFGPITMRGPGRFVCARRGGEVEIEILVSDVEAGGDGIFSLRLTDEQGGVSSLTDAGPEALELRAPGFPRRVVATPERDDAALLVAALGARGRYPLYRAALARAVELTADREDT